MNEPNTDQSPLERVGAAIKQAEKSMDEMTAEQRATLRKDAFSAANQSPLPEPPYANLSGMINVRVLYPTGYHTEFREERIAASPGALAECFYGHASGLHGPLTIGTHPITFEDGDWFEVLDENGNRKGWADGPLLSREESRARIKAACDRAHKRLYEMTPEERRELGRAAYEKIKNYPREAPHNEWTEVQAELNKDKPRKYKPGRIISRNTLLLLAFGIPVLGAIVTAFTNADWERWMLRSADAWIILVTVWVASTANAKE